MQWKKGDFLLRSSSMWKANGFGAREDGAFSSPWWSSLCSQRCTTSQSGQEALGTPPLPRMASSDTTTCDARWRLQEIWQNRKTVFFFHKWEQRIWKQCRRVSAAMAKKKKNVPIMCVCCTLTKYIIFIRLLKADVCLTCRYMTSPFGSYWPFSSVAVELLWEQYCGQR